VGSALVARVVEWGCSIRKPVLIALVLAELVFAAGFIFIRMWPEYYLKAFDIDNEENFTAIFSAVQFVWIAGVIVSFLLVPDLIIKPLRLLAWMAVAGFVFLGLDEYMQMHEQLSNLLVPYDWLPRLKEDVGAWIPVYAVCAVFLLLVFRRAIMMAAQLYPKPSGLFVAGLALLFLGSVGCEIIAFEFLPQNRADPLYPFAVAAEEFLEMSGASLMLFAALTFGAAEFPLALRSANRNSATALVNA
jgi:hypothetical protein